MLFTLFLISYRIAHFVRNLHQFRVVFHFAPLRNASSVQRAFFFITVDTLRKAVETRKRAVKRVAVLFRRRRNIIQIFVRYLRPPRYRTVDNRFQLRAYRIEIYGAG